jgi:ABC-type nitrate/sulfonate/bicarbonate transport system substrate-binding protein
MSSRARSCFASLIAALFALPWFRQAAAADLRKVTFSHSAIKKDPALIKRVIRASLRSLQFLQSNSSDTVKILMAWTRATESDARRSLELAKPGFSKNGLLTDKDLSIEWNFLQQQTKKPGVLVSIAHDMTILREAQRELGM